MTRSSIIAFLIGTVVAAVTYEVTGLHIVGRGAPQAMAVKSQPARAAPSDAVPSGAPALPQAAKPMHEDDSDRVAKLQSEVSEANARAEFAEQQREAVEGRKIVWPANVAPQFKKAAVEQQLKEFVIDRGLAKLKGMDCSEYPCVTILQLTDTGPEASQMLRAALTDMVKRHYDRNVVLSILGSRSEQGANSISLAGVGVVPNEDEVKSRARYRAKQALEEHAP